MSGRVGPTLIGALVILVSMPVALFVFQGMWRSRINQPLPEVRPLAKSPSRIQRGPAATPATSPPPTVPFDLPGSAARQPLRAVDELLIGVFEGRGPEPGKDLLPGGARVDLAAESTGSVARVDLDRDGKWDEVWTIRVDEIVREVSPQDDGDLRERYAWVNGGWVLLP